jgi:preprotein translocase subunit SecY
MPQAIPHTATAAAFSASATVRPSVLMAIAITILCVLAFRAGTYIPLPGVKTDVYAVAASYSGALPRLSILALGIIPYISASILMQLVIWWWPGASAMRDTPRGRRKINGIIRWAAVILAFIQGIAVAHGLRQMHAPGGGNALFDDTPFPYIAIAVTLTAGSMFVVWLSDVITRYGIADGVLIILLVDTLAQVPVNFARTLMVALAGHLALSGIWVAVGGTAALIAVIAVFEGARRRLPVASTQGGESFLSLKLNGSGILALYIAPPIAFTLVSVLLSSVPDLPQLMPDGWHIVLPGLLVLLIAFSCRSNDIKPSAAAAHLNAHGAAIPGVDTGRTAAYAAHVLARISVAGAVYLSLVYIASVLLENVVGGIHDFWAVSTGVTMGRIHTFTAVSLLIAVLVYFDIRAAILGRDPAAPSDG